jgi:DNA-binding CsgD family transcriptional regulator
MTRADQPLPQLTAKQRDVLALVADNRTSKEIAARLGISESAVNQRIEMIRSRLGGLPRGELARLYRQEYSPNEAENGHLAPTWQKIYLPDRASNGNEPFPESISLLHSVSLSHERRQQGDGSQLSAFIFQDKSDWLGREDWATVLARHAAIIGLIVAAMLIAAGVTQLIGPIGGS